MPTVLIVDDEPDNSEFVARFLVRHGYRVSRAANGREAVARLEADAPDAVVLDMQMPEMDGLALLRVVRSHLRWVGLPVVLLTANASDEQVAMARAHGVRHVLHKAGFELDHLLACLREVSLPPGEAGTS